MTYYEHHWLFWLDQLAGLDTSSLSLLPEPERTERRTETYELLKEWTGRDFGYDLDAWKSWMIANPDWETDPEYNARFDATMARRETKWQPFYAPAWEATLGELIGEVPVGVWFLSKREREQRQKRAYELLKSNTGQDFGFNADAWREWMKVNPSDVS